MSSSRGLGGLRKKLAGRFKSKRPRGNDDDYVPTTDSEAQSSAGGTESMDAEDFPHVHPDYPIDIQGWTFPKRRFSMTEYCSRRTVNQYALPSDTNIQFFHTQLQFDVFWGTLVDTNFHKHQVIDWSFLLSQSVMEGLIPKFEACGLYQFMGQRTDFNEMAVKQFLATSEIDIAEESITWMTGFKRYSASFADFAAANSLNYGTISAGVDLYTEDNFEDFVQFYEPARLGIPRRFGETAGLRHHPAVINKIARVTILPKSGDKSKIREKFWNIIHHIMNGEVMNIVLFMMRQLNDLKMDKNQNLAYAPYIMQPRREELQADPDVAAARPLKTQAAAPVKKTPAAPSFRPPGVASRPKIREAGCQAKERGRVGVGRSRLPVGRWEEEESRLHRVAWRR
eukprot:XP_023155911.1 uncharacterized protein LOC111589316 [Zea mays]